MVDEIVTTTATETEDTTEKEKMIPESRLKGIIKEKMEVEKALKDARKALDAKATEGLSELEKLKAEKEALTAQLGEAAKRDVDRDTRLKRIALKAHLTDAITPAAANLVPMDIVDVDEDGELTSASKKAVKEWKQKPDYAPLFSPARRPGNTPAPTDTDQGLTTEKYYAAMADPKLGPAEKDKIHDQYLASRRK